MVRESERFEKSRVRLERSASKGNENWFEKSGVKSERSVSKETENWFKKSRDLRNLGFEKSGLHCTCFMFFYCLKPVFGGFNPIGYLTTGLGVTELLNEIM